MNHKASILVMALAASTAFAQSPATVGTVRNALAAPAQTKTAPATVKTGAPKIAPQKTASSPKRAAKTASKKVTAATNSGKRPSGAKVSEAGRRDPFVSPVSDRMGGGSGCSTGKKCLMADEVLLQGVVTGPNGMIAVVVNSARTAYFMRVNDPVFKGYVVKITPDSIVFKETVTDRMGKPTSREVVKKVNIPAV